MTTYATAITLALEAKGPMTTKQLCCFLAEHEDVVPCLAERPNAWRNGIRHTLSGHRAFYNKTKSNCLQPWLFDEKKLPMQVTILLQRFRRQLTHADPKLQPVEPVSCQTET